MIGRALRLAALVAAIAQIAPAYYFFLHVRSGEDGLRLIPEKFDLAALATGRVQYLVSAKTPEKMAEGDSLNSLLSQLRAAAGVWNSVEDSTLRLEFGGVTSTASEQVTPGIDVVFEELPPGLIAIAGPTARSESVRRGEDEFVPIRRSVMMLPKDLSKQRTFEDQFFLTLVHELGHAVGLQHTMTSSVMSTSVTRGTTRATPLADDDRAGLATLCPVPGSSARNGRIAGRVTMNGAPVHLASVVALTSGGRAVSAVTGPDGRYRIERLAAGSYYLFVHPYPPAFQAGLGPGDVVLPVDQANKPVAASGFFGAKFFPSASSWRDAQLVAVEAGKTSANLDFQVSPRSALPLYEVTTYSFPGRIAVHPAFINVNGQNPFLVASGVGLLANKLPAPGLGVDFVGGAAVIPREKVITYPWADSFLQVGMNFTISPALGPKHLVFTRNGDPHLLPSALHLVSDPPPSVESVAGVVLDSGRPAVEIRGKRFTRRTRFLFDGLAGQVLQPPGDTFPAEGPLYVIPPPGADRHKARVTAHNADGQTSLFLDGANAPEFEYPPAAVSGPLQVFPDGFTAGAERFVEIRSEGAAWMDGVTRLSLGSSDLQVRRVWVLGPDRLLANVAVAPEARKLSADLTITTGFDHRVETGRVQILPADPKHLAISPEVWNPAIGYPSLFPGGEGQLAIRAHTPVAPETAIRATLNGVELEQVRVEGAWLRFRVPGGMAPGLMIFEARAGDRTSGPLLVEIHHAPPEVAAIQHDGGSSVTGGAPARPGSPLQLVLRGFSSNYGVIAPERFAVTAGGQPAKILSAAGVENQPETVVLEIELAQADFKESPAPVVVSLDGRPGLAVPMPVAVTPAAP